MAHEVVGKVIGVSEDGGRVTFWLKQRTVSLEFDPKGEGRNHWLHREVLVVFADDWVTVEGFRFLN
jgi:hypothetical protein